MNNIEALQEIAKAWLKETLWGFHDDLEWVCREERMSNAGCPSGFHCQLGNFFTTKGNPARTIVVHDLHNKKVAKFNVQQIYDHIK